MNTRKHGARRRFGLRAVPQNHLPQDLQPLTLTPSTAAEPPACNLDILLHVRRAAKKEALPMGPATGLVRRP